MRPACPAHQTRRLQMQICTSLSALKWVVNIYATNSSRLPVDSPAPLLTFTALMDSRSHWSRQTAADLPSSTLLAGNEHLISAAGTNQMEPINKTHETNKSRQSREGSLEQTCRLLGYCVPFSVAPSNGLTMVRHSETTINIYLFSTIRKCFWQKILKVVSNWF